MRKRVVFGLLACGFAILSCKHGQTMRFVDTDARAFEAKCSNVCQDEVTSSATHQWGPGTDTRVGFAFDAREEGRYLTVGDALFPKEGAEGPMRRSHARARLPRHDRAVPGRHRFLQRREIDVADATGPTSSADASCKKGGPCAVPPECRQP